MVNSSESGRPKLAYAIMQNSGRFLFRILLEYYRKNGGSLGLKIAVRCENKGPQIDLQFR
jgi:hypothetical protein